MEDFEQAPLPNKLDYVAIAGAVVPFVLTLRTSNSSSSSETVNGVVTQSSEVVHFKDYAALVGGAVAIVFALFTFTLLAKTPPEKKAARIALSVLLLVAGLYQLVVRGGLLS